MAAKERKIAAPQPNAETKAFWDAALEEAARMESLIDWSQPEYYEGYLPSSSDDDE